MFYCGFYNLDVAVAFLNHFLTVGRHGVNGCRIKTTIKGNINVSITPLFYNGSTQFCIRCISFLSLGCGVGVNRHWRRMSIVVGGGCQDDVHPRKWIRTREVGTARQTNKPLGGIIALVFRRLPATSMSRAMLCMRGAVDISCLPAHNIV
jgi:hypothetical protein